MGGGEAFHVRKELRALCHDGSRCFCRSFCMRRGILVVQVGSDLDAGVRCRAPSLRRDGQFASSH